MQYLGEVISLVVALSWTATALFADIASHRLGSLPLNLIRMFLSLLMLSALMWTVTGVPYPEYADTATWIWLVLSGLVGYVFGDWCLFNSYVIFGSRYGQLFMTLAPPMAGLAGFFMLGESLSWKSCLAMLVTLSGIAISILVRGGEEGRGRVHVKLPVKGILFGIGAGVGQGVGLVLSKIGLGHFSSAIPPEATDAVRTMIPFEGTFIRAVAGLLGFFVIISLRKDFGRVSKAVQDRKGMLFAVLTTFFGPFIGVSLSLMAVQYAKAGIASTLMALTPVLIILPYSIINHQKISAKEVIGAFVTMAGVAMFFLL